MGGSQGARHINQAVWGALDGLLERFEPAVQYLQDGLGVFFIVGRGPDQFAADGERLGEAPAVIVHCQLRALGIGV